VVFYGHGKCFKRSLGTNKIQIVKSISGKNLLEDILIFMSGYILIYHQMANPIAFVQEPGVPRPVRNDWFIHLIGIASNKFSFN